MTETSN